MRAFRHNLWAKLKAVAIALGAPLGKLWRVIPSPIRLIVRNIAGSLFILIGLVLAIPGVPGPGIPTVVVGFLLLDFPQKRAMLRRLQHSWLIQKFLRNGMFAKLWRHVRRKAKNSEVSPKRSLPDQANRA